MRVFVTGASGFVGFPTVEILKTAGHEVVGLARSDESAAKLKQLGVRVVRGELTDFEVLRQSAAESDGVLHLGFVYDFANLQRSVEIDLDAIRAMLAGMAGSGKVFVGTNGTLGIKADGQVATEHTPLADPMAARGPAELLVRNAEGVRGMVISLAPTVHGEGDHSFIPELIDRAKQNGVSLYPGEGLNTWQAVYRDDAAELYRLVLEQGRAGRRYHGIAEPAIRLRNIADAIGHGLGLETQSVPLEQAVHQMGWIGFVATLGGPVSSQLTQEELGWKPVGPTLFEDMPACYFSFRGVKEPAIPL